jgi:PAS domain S-box-containing protein
MMKLYPAADRIERSSASSLREEPSAKPPLRVLLVEDNEDDSALMVRLLRRGGYEPIWKKVQTAGELEEALAEGSWDIVLSDYNMPQFDAISALKVVREQPGFLPFIIISGSIGEETAVAAMRAGADDYLMKTNLARLLPAIERELREAAERRERARTKKAFLDLQEKFEVIFRENLDVMMVLDAANGEILHINRAVNEVMGYDEFRLASQPFCTLWPGDQRAAAEGLLAQVRREGSVFYSGEFKRLDGSRCPMDLLANKLPWGRDEAIIVTLRDVTERHRAEQRLADEKEHLAVTLRSIGEGVITTDARGRILLLNGAAERLTGWRQPEAVGKPLCHVLRLSHDNGEEVCENEISQVLRTGETLEMTKHLVLHSRDGRQRSLALTSAPIRGHDGKINGVVTIFRDITGEQKREEELQKASKMESVSLLAGGIAHDFNNVLTAILGHVSLAKASATTPEAFISTVEKACLYATDLTRQLLTFAKGGSPNRCVESVTEIIKESVDFSLHGSSLRCHFDLAEDLRPVEVDRNQIHQVLNNLVINAVQASPRGGSLKVSAENARVTREQPVGTLEPGDYVRISIADNGSGIAPEHLSRIFDPYFTTKTTGSGLGLSTSYSIIHKHEGLLQVESAVGKGTTFSIYLPASAAPAPAAAEEPSAAATPAARENPSASDGPKRVLFMDDEEVLQELVGAMLNYLGYEVECAADGNQALEKYAQAKAAGQPFDVVMVDLTVPGGMGGYEAVQRLLAMDPDVKAIVSSGYSNDPIMAEFQLHGFKGVIAKPYQLVELGGVLEQVIHSPKGGFR